jgi:hypothetical protein
MLQQESIYNIIPVKKIIPNRPSHYISIYPSDIAPTASTFILNGSSLPGISNCNGDFKLPRGGHSTLKKSATFGLPIGAYAADPKHFHKKGVTYKILPPVEKLHSFCKIKKLPIPSINDRPIQGLKSKKNYVLSNAIDNILMKTGKLKPTKSCEDIRHPYYGKVPNYIKKFRKAKEDEINNEKELSRKLKEQEDAKRKILSKEEIEQLREGLTKKWQMYNFRYGNITHKKLFDNLVLLRK